MKISLFIVSMVVMSAGSTFCQGPTVNIVPGIVQPHGFTNQIPDRSMWRISVERMSEKNSASGKDLETPYQESEKPSRKRVEEIEVAYASGLRREIVRYSDKTEAIGYIGKGLVVYLDPATGAPLFGDSEARVGEYTFGSDRWEEFSWVSPKFFIGTNTYRGRQCDVYRQFAPPQLRDGEYDEDRQNLAHSELNGNDGEIVNTAFIDVETKLPLALQNATEARIYQKLPSFKPFSMPPKVVEAIQQQAEAIKRRQQRFNISR